MMSLAFGLFFQMSDSGSQGPLVFYFTNLEALSKLKFTPLSPPPTPLSPNPPNKKIRFGFFANLSKIHLPRSTAPKISDLYSLSKKAPTPIPPTRPFLCPRRNFGRHIKNEPSIRPSVRPLQIVSAIAHKLLKQI